MPRENSFSDSEGRSLTPDQDEDFLRVSDIRTEDPPAPVENGPAQTQNGGEEHQQPEPHQNQLARMASVITHRSKRSHNVPPAPKLNVRVLTPKERFRAAARKVMAMHRGTSILGGRRIGAEPGIDPRRQSANELYGSIKQNCEIEIVDYSAVRCQSRHYTNKTFIDLMSNDEAVKRESWVKVRWINIGGLSWDVIKAVSLRYNLHPLALEDVFNGHRRNRSKADYYMKHLFLRVLCHELVDSDDGPTTIPGAVRSFSPEPMDSYEEDMADEETNGYSRKSSGSSPFSKKKHKHLLPKNINDLEAMMGPQKTPHPKSELSKLMVKEIQTDDEHRKMAEEEVSIAALKRGERVNVNVSPMFIFLFRDGLVISITPTPNLELTSPITQRLKVWDTGLRTSADASLLVHALLDLIVDKALQVIDQYHTKITKYEQAILLKPKMGTVRRLHILSGDLILHKRTLEPIKTLIYGLRRYDVDRCAALIDTNDPANANLKIVGFMSHKAKIYLADVYDHMDYILSSLEMFASIAENLISYTFNLASYEMNEVMRRLTYTTIIFLPLTLLTGYFGMNFEFMWSVQQNSDVLFWEIAIPLMIFIIPIFVLPDIRRMYHYIQKQLVSKKAIKNYKQA